jgi:hypothetical protein
VPPPHSPPHPTPARRSTLRFALRRLSHERLVIDPKLLNQYVTLIFIGTISALSIRAFMRHASQVGGAGRVVCGLGGWGRGERVGRRGRAGRDGGPGAGLGSMVRARHPRPQTLDAPPPPRPQIFSAATRLTGRAGRAGRGAGAGGASLVALLSELTGVYAISSLLLIRRNVPLAHRAAIDGAMGGGLEFQFFHRSGGKGEGVVGGGGDCAPSFGAESARHSLPAPPPPPPPTPPHPTPPPKRWFNALFIASALVTAGLYWIKHRMGAADGLGEPALPVYAKGASARQ